jgi:hypothetical protein
LRWLTKRRPRGGRASSTLYRWNKQPMPRSRAPKRRRQRQWSSAAIRALEVARKAPAAELFRSAGGHYDVYEGGASFADVLRTEVDFLHHHVKTATQKLS